MFVVRIEMKLRPEQRNAFQDYVRIDGLEARKLPGCVDYSFCEDVGNPLRVLLYEEWSTREQFDAYRASTVFSASGPRLRSMSAEPPKSAYYEADNVFEACAVR